MAENQSDKIAAGTAAHSGGAQGQNFLPRLFYALCIAGGLACAYAVLQQNSAEKWILPLISFYAAAGVFFLLCAAFGVCRFGFKDSETSASADILDNLAAAIVLTDKTGRFIYGNKAYRRLAGAALRTPEMLLARDEKAAKAVCRLTQAAKEGRNLKEILHFSRNPFAASAAAPGQGAADLAQSAAAAPEKTAGEANLYYAVDVRPFFSGGYALSMWTISESPGQTGGQDFIPKLQEAINYFDNAPAGFLSWDRQGKIAFFNAALTRLLHLDFSRRPDNLSLEILFGRESAAEILAWEQALPRQSSDKKRSEAEDSYLAINYRDKNGEARSFYLYAGDYQPQGNVSQALLLPNNTGFAAFADSQKPEYALASDKIAGAEISADEAPNFAADEYFYRSPIALAAIKRDFKTMQMNGRFQALFALPPAEQGRAAKLTGNLQANTAAAPQPKAEAGPDAARNIARFLAAMAEQNRENVIKSIEAAFRDGAAESAALDAVLPGEPMRYIRLYITPVHAGGRVGSVIIAAVETTRQRALEQQMEHSQKMQAVGQLAGGIAHDFNNVLTAIIMSCDLLLSSHRSSDPSHSDIITIKNNAGRAASLVRQLLAFSRRQTLRPEVLDLTDMLADLRMLAVRLAGASVRLKIEHGRSLWPVKADQAELERVLMNLVANARDAMPQGGDLIIRTENISEEESRKLSYQGFAAGDYVLIEVADSGSGIAPEIIGKIFDPFFTTKEVGKGTGLGLSMVYGIIRQTGGYIYCRSVLGEGTVFSIYLPRYIPPQAAQTDIYGEILNAGDSVLAESEAEFYKKDAVYKGGAAKAESPRAAGGGDFAARRGADLQSAGGRQPAAQNLQKHIRQPAAVDLSGSANVLLVEDEDAVRMAGVKALQSRGYRVFEAESGVEALRIIEERGGAIDIIVSDVVMPEMDGPSLLKAVQNSYPHIKFIFVSGYAREAFAKNLPEDADFAFLAKPFSLKQLAGSVKEMLESGKISG